MNFESIFSAICILIAEERGFKCKYLRFFDTSENLDPSSSLLIWGQIVSAVLDREVLTSFTENIWINSERVARVSAASKYKAVVLFGMAMEIEDKSYIFEGIDEFGKKVYLRVHPTTRL